MYTTKLIIYFLTALRWIKNLILTLLIISFFSQFLDNLERYPTLNRLNMTVNNSTSFITKEIKKFIPYRYKNIDFSMLILAILIQIIAAQIFSIEQNLRRKSYLKENPIPPQMPTDTTTQEKPVRADGKEMNSTLTNMSIQESGDRKKMLKQFASLKSKLDEMGKQLAFLAIDVVDSTGMKQDEDRHIVSFAFERYNELVNESLREYGVLKYSMTPDGIMSCFRTVDDAVNAASCLLKKLEKFNQEEKLIKRDFQIRCGINAGFVYLDDETPLEQVSDRVIDIAGHMQKYAKPNSINIAASAIEPLKNSKGFKETTDVIDGEKVYQWVNKTPNGL